MKQPIESNDINHEYLNIGGTFKEVANIDNESMESIYAVGYNLYQAGKYDDAKNIFQFLSYYDHYNHKFFNSLASCFMMKKNYEKAIELFNCAHRLNKKDAKILINMGDCYLNINDTKNAKKTYETVKKISKNDKKNNKYYEKSCAILKNISN